MEQLITDYYTNIFSSRSVQIGEDLDGVNMKVTIADNDALTRPFTHKEIKLAVFSMSSDKAPGPDGFNPTLF